MDMETLGYFIFMDEQERKEKEQQEDINDNNSSPQRRIEGFTD